MIDEEILNQLTQQNWPEFLKKLVYYASNVSKKYYWKTKSDTLPKGLQPEEIAFEAISSVFEGKRNWNPSKDPDLLIYLKGIVYS